MIVGFIFFKRYKSQKDLQNQHVNGSIVDSIFERFNPFKGVKSKRPDQKDNFDLKNENGNDPIIPSNVPKSNNWYQTPKLQKNEAEKISQIDASQLVFESKIGNGSFGEVWKGKWRLLSVAIKQIKQEIINEKSKKMLGKNMKSLIYQSIIQSHFFILQFSNYT